MDDVLKSLVDKIKARPGFETERVTPEVVRELIKDYTLTQVQELHDWLIEVMTITALIGDIHNATLAEGLHDTVCEYLSERKKQTSLN